MFLSIVFYEKKKITIVVFKDYSITVIQATEDEHNIILFDILMKRSDYVDHYDYHIVELISRRNF